MISVDDFGRLRIEDYRLDDRVGCSDDWRFLGRVSFVAQAQSAGTIVGPHRQVGV
jgi:hypothetical protein